MSLRRHQFSWRHRLRRWILRWVDRWLPEGPQGEELRFRWMVSAREERLLGNRLRRKLRVRHHSELLDK